MRIRQPGISPENIAIAVAVTMAAMAGMGGMKNVTGTSSAVAIVAVSPGTAPTNRPKSAANSITTQLYRANPSAAAGSQASLIAGSPCHALQHAPRQRHLQHLVEGVVDGQRAEHRHDDRT